jgi:multidrug efflux pump subunit AcrB
MRWRRQLPQNQLLTNVARLERGSTASVVNHYNVQPLYDVYANVQDRDLGSSGAARCISVLDEFRRSQAAQGQLLSKPAVRSRPCRTSFIGLGAGMVFAIRAGLFRDGGQLPILARSVHHPDGLAGRALGHPARCSYVTQTTINVPSLMGAIMSIGVATANSILLVNFANDRARHRRRF